MNAIRNLFAVAALVSVMPAAFAASTVDLTVSGTIIPASCTPVLSATDINFGKISSADLLPDELNNRIGKNIRTTLSVNCSSPTIYGLRGIDNRSTSVIPTGFHSPYGLGFTPNGEKLGGHHLEILAGSSLIDSRPTFITVSDPSATTWGASAADVRALRNSGPLLGFTDVAGVTTGPIPIKDAQFKLFHYLVIAPTDSLTLTDDVALDGSATVEVVYL